MAALTQSYVHGASSTPLLGETIGALLRRMAEEGPQRPALITRHQNVRCGPMRIASEGPKTSRSGSGGSAAEGPTALAGLILVNINPAYR